MVGFKAVSYTHLQIPVYQKQRLPCRKFYGRAGAFFLYCVLSGGKGKLTPIGQGDIGDVYKRQIPCYLK